MIGAVGSPDVRLILEGSHAQHSVPSVANGVHSQSLCPKLPSMTFAVGGEVQKHPVGSIIIRGVVHDLIDRQRKKNKPVTSARY